MSINVKRIKNLSTFRKYPTYWGEKYEALRFEDREIALERWGNKIRVCLCLPYQSNKDNESGVVGRGAGEVIAEWFTNNEAEAVKIINKHCLTPIRLDKIDLY